jgi:mortality factor 4-like protein 1
MARIKPDPENPGDLEDYDSSDLSDVSDPPDNLPSVFCPEDDSQTCAESEVNGIEQEESFITRPSIRIVMPDNLKSLIVDDWERVTKNGSVVALPAPKPVRQILQDWRDEEEPKRSENRIDIDVLDEVISGMLEYFDVMLDRVLLYRYERAQYRVFRKKFQDVPGMGPVDIYGGEHLIRLFSK